MATKAEAWKVGEKGAPFFPDEFEVYNAQQQRQEYLVEFTWDECW